MICSQILASPLNRWLRQSGFYLRAKRFYAYCLGVDHGGFPLKKTVSAAIEAANHEVLDLGTFDETPVDYPDYAKSVAEAMANGRANGEY